MTDTKDTTVILQKGESMKFLDYTIQNSLNNDGLVLFKEGGKNYESHLGNYGNGTQDSIDLCKKYALLHFMIARPEVFAKSLANKINKKNSGTMHEYYLLVHACKREGIEFPKEVTAGDDLNLMIYFQGKPLTQDWK